MEQIEFNENNASPIILQIIDELIDELFELNFKLVTQEKEDNYEDAHQTQLFIDKVIETTNTTVFALSNLDRKQNLIQKNEEIRELVTINYNKVIKALETEKINKGFEEIE